MRKLQYNILLPALLLLATHFSFSQSIVFTNVTIIDVRDGAAVPAMTVVISGERILDVGQFSTTEVPAGAKVINASGKYLIPGLWDMHSHTWNAEDTRNTVFPLDIAHGIVGIRNMCGDCRGNNLDCIDRATYEGIVAIKKEVEEGKVIGPRIYNASTFLDGRNSTKKEALIITSPAQAREVVRDHKRKNFDLLKVYEYLDRDVFLALADEAEKVNIDFGGHVPWAVTVKEAVEAGQKSIEHGYGLFEAVSGMETTFVEERVLALSNAEFSGKNRGNLLHGPNGQLTRMLNLKEKRFMLKDSLVQDLSKILKENNSWIVPTFAMDAVFLEYREMTNHNLMKYIPLRHREEWGKAIEEYAGLNEEYKQAGQIWVNDSGKLINQFHKAGVGILAGTDCDVKLIVPGYHLHKELEFMVEAGLTPNEALQTATLNAAKYFESETDMGTVEKGKIADLVLLDANPLEDISNTRKILAVVANGRYFDRQALDEMLSKAEQAANTQEDNTQKY